MLAICYSREFTRRSRRIMTPLSAVVYCRMRAGYPLPTSATAAAVHSWVRLFRCFPRHLSFTPAVAIAAQRSRIFFLPAASGTILATQSLAVFFFHLPQAASFLPHNLWPIFFSPAASGIMHVSGPFKFSHVHCQRPLSPSKSF